MKNTKGGMVDISGKEPTLREAVVEGRVRMKEEVLERIRKGKIPKGDVLEVSRIAGIQAAKRTWELIPLCHPIPIEHIDIEFSYGRGEIIITSRVKGRAKTGVEMEAFVATTVAALTIYDMGKAFDPEMEITGVILREKKGGKSGVFRRES